jgi:hypothetical protein
MSEGVEKEVLSTKDCWLVAGSRPHFEELLDLFPHVLSPYRIGKPTGAKPDGQPKKGKTEYLRTDLLAAFKAYKMTISRKLSHQ